MRYINDPRYLLKDGDSMKTGRLRRRKTDVDSRAAAVESQKSYGKQTTLQAISLRATGVSEEMFLNYNMEYWLG